MAPTKRWAGMDRNLTSYGDVGFSRYMRRAFLSSAGYDAQDLDRPVVGIASTVSDFNPCHRDMPALIEAVKRGVLEAGGLPFVFPTCSLHEILMSPTTMLYRNLLAMETEEMIRAHPMDAVVLMGGCDKTVPAQLMAALSADVPAVQLVTGPMRTGSWRGERLGACTDCRRLWAKHRAEELTAGDIAEVESRLCSTAGTCMVMGTASTMACLAEALGMAVSGSATAPSNSGDRLRVGVRTGRCAVALAEAGTRPREIVTRASLLNAIRVLMAIGGSTNAVVHLLALARRARVPLCLEDFAEISREVPVLVNCKPVGVGYLEDMHAAGGMPVLLRALSSLLELEAKTVAGETLAELVDGYASPAAWQDTIRCLDTPVQGPGALVVLRGNLAPDGAIMKRAAASPSLLEHRGPAVVFESPEDVALRIDDPSLRITPDHVLVMRNGGPKAAGMPEAGGLPIPKYLAEKGVKDMVRISDARMSGTAYGTVVLHCAPEAAAGGPLAFIRTGDVVALSVEGKTVDLCVDEKELASRRDGWQPPPLPERGWRRLYAQHVTQANEGADLDFL